MKDNRKTYRNKQIEVNGTVVHFDGKFSPATDTLKIYRIYGDVSLFDEAIQNFCIDNNIGIALLPE